MTDEEMAVNWIRSQGWNEENLPSDEFGQMVQAYLAGLKTGRPQWNEYSERPKEKINALCFDIEQNKFILGFYDLEADEWLRYGGYETINIDLWTKIEIPEFIKE